MPSTQKALFLDKKFGQFVLGDAKVSKPGPGELLIKIQATSLNPVDWKIQKHGYSRKWPAILGMDIAGDVEEVGEGVTDLKKGDRVFSQGRFESEYASYQQYTLALASTVAKIPSNISYEQASTVAVALTCAYVGLYNQNPYGLGIAPPISKETQGKFTGTPFVVLGGATSVGQMTLQLAKLSGFSPIFVTASLKHTEFLKSLGATHILDRKLPTNDLVAEIKKVTDKPVEYVYDSVSSAETQQLSLDVVASGGQVLTVLAFSVKIPEDKTVIHVFGLLTLPHNFDLLETLYHDKISGWLEQGFIKPNNIEVLPNGLAAIAGGLARLEADTISGLKLVVRPQETP